MSKEPTTVKITKLQEYHKKNPVDQKTEEEYAEFIKTEATRLKPDVGLLESILRNMKDLTILRDLSGMNARGDVITLVEKRINDLASTKDAKRK